MNSIPSWLLPLGPTRVSLLDCMGANLPMVPAYFHPAPGPDIFVAFRNHMQHLLSQWADQPDPAAELLVGAARLLIGDKRAARHLVERFPTAALTLDHGSGRCRRVPFQILKAVVPFPPALGDIECWIRGNAIQSELLSWLEQHEADLEWLERDGIYKLREGAIT